MGKKDRQFTAVSGDGDGVIFVPLSQSRDFNTLFGTLQTDGSSLSLVTLASKHRTSKFINVERLPALSPLLLFFPFLAQLTFTDSF